MNEHAILSASSASRWLACPPSARLEESLPETASPYAEEGTLAHEMAKVELQKYLFRISATAYTEAWTAFRADSRVTEDFKAAVHLYVQSAIQKIEHARRINRDAEIFLEQRLDYSRVVPEGFGTGDLVIVCDGILEVIDLKFGKGIVVSPVENPQAKLYGFGALEETGLLYDIHTIRLTIHQPRLSPEPESWDIPLEDLRAWAGSIAPIARAAWAGDGEFNPGDHCRFCKAKGQCRARAEANLDLAQQEFKLPHLLSDEDISRLYAKLDPLIKWANDVKAYALKAACNGRKFAGWKLVRGRSNRRYKDPQAAAKALIAAGFPGEAIYQPPVERQLLGITEMERLITKKKFTELLEPFVEKPPGSLTLVAANDKRPEVEADQASGFDITEEVEE